MFQIKVEVVGLKELQKSLGSFSLQPALVKTFNSAVLSLHHDIRAGIKQLYACPYDAAAVATIVKASETKPEASISYQYKPIPLSRFPVQQVRVTVGGGKLKVTRLGKSGRFNRKRITNKAITYTKVMVLRAGGFKLVEGTSRYGYNKGWLHTGKGRLFSSQVYERNQRATWSGSQRLPFHRLFGPSISQMVQSPRIQQIILESPYMQDIENILLRNLFNSV